VFDVAPASGAAAQGTDAAPPTFVLGVDRDLLERTVNGDGRGA